MASSKFAPRRIVRAAIFLALVFGVSASAFAQSAPPSAQDLNPIERVPVAPKAPTGGTGVLAPPAPAPCPFSGQSSALSFVLRDVSFEGAEKIDPEDFLPAYADLVGRKISVAAICGIRDRAADILFNKGILARVEIVPQKISQGRLRLEVIEAYVAFVVVHGNVGPVRGKVAQYVETLRGMKPFDINRAKRYLFLASDIPGVRISATLAPTPVGRGAIVLDITIYRDPMSALINVQNEGSHSAGPYSALARIDLNSFTALGERTTFVISSTIQPREQRVLQWVEEARLGSEGLLARTSLSWGTSHPGGVLAPLHLNGQSIVGEMGLFFPVIRDRHTDLNATGGLDVIQQDLEFGGTALTRDRIRVAHAGADSSYTWNGDIPGSASLQVEVRKGIEGLGASHAGDPVLSRSQGRPDALEVRSNGSLLLQWLPHLSTLATYQAQYADKPLLSYEELAAGNFTIGRGYDPSAVSGDRGIEGSVELRIDPVSVFGNFFAGAKGFIDIAHLQNLDVGSQNKTLRSVGGGLNFELGGLSQLELTYARPLDEITSGTGKKLSGRLLLNLTVGL